MPIYCTKGTISMYKSDVHTFQLSQVFYHQDRQTAIQTDRHFIRRIRIHSHTKWFTIQCT